MALSKKYLLLSLGVVYAMIAVASDDDSKEIQPSCSEPARLNGKYDPAAPGYIVMLKNATDTKMEMARLAARFGFKVKVPLEAISSFSAEMSPEVVAKLRCEPTIKSIDRNLSVHAASNSIYNKSINHALAVPDSQVRGY